MPSRTNLYKRFRSGAAGLAEYDRVMERNHDRKLRRRPDAAERIARAEARRERRALRPQGVYEL